MKLKMAVMTRILIFTLVFICIISFSACGEISLNELGTQEPAHDTALQISSDVPRQITVNPHAKSLLCRLGCSTMHESLRVYYEAAASDTSALPSESEDTLSKQAQWQLNICPDMPQPYAEVLKQYEQFMNADNRNINDESVQAILRDGEWNYLYDEICMAWVSFIDRSSVEEAEKILRYSLTDLTGDGFPEMIIAFGDTPDVIYNYSESKGIGMEYASSYYTMTIYRNGIVEYVSGGAYSSTTYLHFQEDTQDWVVADTIAASDTWDAVNREMNDTEYYGGEWGEDGLLDKIITKQEYLQIQEKYVTEPMDFDWIPLAYCNF